MALDGKCNSNRISVSTSTARVENAPLLWLGHLVGASPLPWKQFEVPGVILNAYQILNKTRNGQNEIADIMSEIESAPLMIDSGGYYFIKNPNCAIDVTHLAEIYRKIDAEMLVSLDIPPHPKLEKEAMTERWEQTKKNAFELSEKFREKKIMPVVHGYSEKALLKHSHEIAELIAESGMIGFGGIVPLFKVNRTLCLELVRFLRLLHPDKLLHVFGVGSVSTMMLLAALGVDSMDTIGWRIKAAYGAIQLPSTSDRFVSPKKNAKKPRKELSPQELDLLSNCQCPICCNSSLAQKLGKLDNSKSSTFENRAVHNAWVFTQELQRTRQLLNQGILMDYLKEKMSVGYWRSSYKRVTELLQKGPSS